MGGFGEWFEKNVTQPIAGVGSVIGGQNNPIWGPDNIFHSGFGQEAIDVVTGKKGAKEEKKAHDEAEAENKDIWDQFMIDWQEAQAQNQINYQEWMDKLDAASKQQKEDYDTAMETYRTDVESANTVNKENWETYVADQETKYAEFRDYVDKTNIENQKLYTDYTDFIKKDQADRQELMNRPLGYLEGQLSYFKGGEAPDSETGRAGYKLASSAANQQQNSLIELQKQGQGALASSRKGMFDTLTNQAAFRNPYGQSGAEAGKAMAFERSLIPQQIGLSMMPGEEMAKWKTGQAESAMGNLMNLQVAGANYSPPPMSAMAGMQGSTMAPQQNVAGYVAPPGQIVPSSPYQQGALPQQPFVSPDYSSANYWNGLGNLGALGIGSLLGGGLGAFGSIRSIGSGIADYFTPPSDPGYYGNSGVVNSSSLPASRNKPGNQLVYNPDDYPLGVGVMGGPNNPGTYNPDDYPLGISNFLL